LGYVRFAECIDSASLGSRPRLRLFEHVHYVPLPRCGGGTLAFVVWPLTAVQNCVRLALLPGLEPWFSRLLDWHDGELSAPFL